MVINPDVTVRSRGVMEKCSMCIQSTQAVILKAKLEGRPVAEGEFNDKVACSAACTTGAIKFGDINEKDSEIYKLKNDDSCVLYTSPSPRDKRQTRMRCSA